MQYKIGVLPGRGTVTNQPAESPESSPKKPSLHTLPIDKIYRSPHQMRRHFDSQSLEELADSLRLEGLLQAITVRPMGNAFELVAGERRLRAAQILGWETIEARVVEISDEDAAIKGLIENLQRRDLSPIDEARGYKQLVEPPYQMTQEAIARRVGKCQTSIARSLAVLELPAEIQELMPKGTITESHTRYLRRISNRAEQVRMASRIDREGWSVKETERRVNELLGKPELNRRSEKRRQSDRLSSIRSVNDRDPLADVWAEVLAADQDAGPALDEARYEGEGCWDLRIKLSAMDNARASLGDFFVRLGHTLNGPLPSSEKARRGKPHSS